MVTTLTSLGFLMIGFDNGLLGGVGVYKIFTRYKDLSRLITKTCLVNGDAFNNTFNRPSQTLIGTIVSIYNGRSSVYKDACWRGSIYQQFP